jgi:hypothetical protein
MPEKKISLVTDAEGLDQALLKFFLANAAKAEAETEKLKQETRTLAAEELYFQAHTQLAVNDLKMYDDQEAVALRKANIKLRARKDNRELQRELSSMGRHEKPAQGEWRKGAKPVQGKPAPKPEAAPLTHHMKIPEQQPAPQEATPS